MYTALVVYALTAVDSSALSLPTACTLENRNACQTGTSCVPFADSDAGFCIAESYLGVAVGHDHICGLVPDGSLQCWDPEDRGLFPTVPDVGGYIVEVAAGDNHICVLHSDGSVECWGENAIGQLGQGSTDDAAAPTSVNLGTTAMTLACSGDSCCVITEDSQLLCWGDNTEGLFGLGTTGIVGDDETPADNGMSATSAPVMDFSIEENHVCVETNDGQNTCAGKSWNGKIRF